MRFRFDPDTGLVVPALERVRRASKQRKRLYMPGIISAARGARAAYILGGIITGGVNFGDLTTSGGLVAAYDGNLSQTSTTGAQKGSSNTAFIGKTISRRLFKFHFYGANNNGYNSSANPNVTLAVRAKVGGVAPTLALAPTAGVPLGSVGPFVDTANSVNDPREVISLNNETVFDHFWVYITHSGGTGSSINMCEFIPFEAV